MTVIRSTTDKQAGEVFTIYKCLRWLMAASITKLIETLIEPTQAVFTFV